MSIKTAMHRMKQRSKFPVGSKIVTRICSDCSTPMMYWSGDSALWLPTVRCSACIERNKNLFRSLRGKSGT